MPPERGVDLSKVVLTHYSLKALGKRMVPLENNDDSPKLQPLTEAGSSAVQEKEKARLAENHHQAERLVRG